MPELPPTSVKPPTDPDEPGGTGVPEGTHTPIMPPGGFVSIEAGTVIAGRYKLVKELGHGGMGAVWMAEQTEPVRRLVALKLILTGMDSHEFLTRFEAERQALSMMDHPNIARVFDAGTLPDSRPFFVMELVKGIPITKYCDDQKLTPRQRLELFVPVCNAIQHAHQKGIIHRDIKPNNVLVAVHDDKPVPKVIDFGVAKATGQPLSDKTMHTLGIVGTPEYMSPEQATENQLDIDTRSDVYSLGVLLYELLTGTTPVKASGLKQKVLLEILRIVREVEAPRLSTFLSSTDTLPSIAAVRGTEPARLSKEFRGELDWIAMKALEKDRARRYETANNFAADVQRYLAGEPVLAHPPSASYRVKKFVRKNRAAVFTTAAVLAGALLAVGGQTWNVLRARAAEADAVAARNAEAEQRLIAEEKERVALKAVEEERQAKLREAAQLAIAIEQRARAEKARDRTRDVLDAMTSEFTGDSLATQKAITQEQKKFLTDVLTYYQEFAGEQADDELSRKRTALAATKVGLIEYRLGHKEEATRAFRMARDSCAALAADFPIVPAHCQELARSHNSLGFLLNDLGKREQAKAEYLQALTLQEKLAAHFPSVPACRQDLALSHNNLGNLLNDLGKREQAKAEYLQALTLQEKLVADFADVPAYRQELARSHNNLGIVFDDLGKEAEAEAEFRKALTIQEKLAAAFPTMPAYRQELATYHNNLGVHLNDLRKREEAESEFHKALTIQEKLAADFPTVPAYRQDLALSHFNLGNLLDDLRKRGEAEAEYRKALTIQEKLVADFPVVPTYRQDLARSHFNLGVLLKELGKRGEAEAEYRKALAIREKLAADFPTMPAYRQNLSRTAYHCACLLAITSGKEADKKQEYADRAMEMLHKAVKVGFTDAAHMAKDKDLDPLRDRADFKKLLDSLQPKPNVKARELAPPPRAVPNSGR